MHIIWLKMNLYRLSISSYFPMVRGTPGIDLNPSPPHDDTQPLDESEYQVNTQVTYGIFNGVQFESMVF